MINYKKIDEIFSLMVKVIIYTYSLLGFSFMNYSTLKFKLSSLMTK